MQMAASEHVIYVCLRPVFRGKETFIHLSITHEIMWYFFSKMYRSKFITLNVCPTNTPRIFHVEATWKRSFPRCFNVEDTWSVCRVVIYIPYILCSYLGHLVYYHLYGRGTIVKSIELLLSCI